MGLKVRLHRRAEPRPSTHPRPSGPGSGRRGRRADARRDAPEHPASRPTPFLLGRPTAEAEIRLPSLTRYPYRVYYTVTAVAVVILHIRHMARLDPDLGDLGH